MRRLTLISAFALAVFLTGQAFAVDSVGDADITYWVKDAFRQDPRIDAYQLDVSVRKGIVTLSGNLGSLAAKEYAVREAKKIDGVRGVEDAIRVVSSYRADSDIIDEIRRRILNSATIESQGIAVNSENGKVILTGRVATRAEAEEARLLAGEVRGVKEVVNDIDAEYKTVRSDQEIKDDAVARLKRDVYLTGLPITVSVKDGVITLEGSVGNAYEKERAGDRVRWISHVRGVQNRIEVNRWKNRGVRKAQPQPSDKVLKKTVQDELDQDIRIQDSDISIRVSDGHVILDGFVSDLSQKRIAEADARNVVGVGWVTNHLLVRPTLRSDEAIRDDVVFKLRTDAVLYRFDIDATVKDRIVALEGATDSWYDKLRAENAASRVRGVRKVVDHIRVDWERTYPGASLIRTIENRLKWNWATGSVSDSIQVRNDDGLISLTGNVGTWAEREEAGRVALETAGVWALDNRLAVNGFDYPWEEWHYKGPATYDPLYNPYRENGFDSLVR